jgi:hypothetical protein
MLAGSAIEGTTQGAKCGAAAGAACTPRPAAHTPTQHTRFRGAMRSVHVTSSPVDQRVFDYTQYIAYLPTATKQPQKDAEWDGNVRQVPKRGARARNQCQMMECMSKYHLRRTQRLVGRPLMHDMARPAARRVRRSAAGCNPAQPRATRGCAGLPRVPGPPSFVGLGASSHGRVAGCPLRAGRRAPTAQTTHGSGGACHCTDTHATDSCDYLQPNRGLGTRSKAPERCSHEAGPGDRLLPPRFWHVIARHGARTCAQQASEGHPVVLCLRCCITAWASKHAGNPAGAAKGPAQHYGVHMGTTECNHGKV